MKSASSFLPISSTSLPLVADIWGSKPVGFLVLLVRLVGITRVKRATPIVIDFDFECDTYLCGFPFEILTLPILHLQLYPRISLSSHSWPAGNATSGLHGPLRRWK